MPLFTYKAKNDKGKIIEDTIQASNKSEAASVLKSNGLKVLTIKGVETGISTMMSGRVSVSDKANFCRFMAVMLRSGMSIPDAAEIIKEENTNKKMKKVLADVASQTRKGKTLSSVLSEYKNDFDPVFLTMVKAGEESGTLQESFEYLAKQLMSSYDLSQKIKGSLMYPAVIIAAMVGVGVLMVTFVLPKISDVFLKMKLDLPAMTKVVLTLGTFFGSHIPLVFISLGVFFVMVFLLAYIRQTRQFFLRLLSKLPVARDIMEQIDMARFANTLSTLLKSGVPILEALNVAAESMSRPKVREQAKKFSVGVAKGESLSSVLIKARGSFPLIVIQTVKAGEKTGTLEEVLEEMADFYEREVEHSLKRFTALLEPVLMLVVGIAVGGMVVLMIAPIYSIVGGLQKSIQR